MNKFRAKCVRCVLAWRGVLRYVTFYREYKKAMLYSKDVQKPYANKFRDIECVRRFSMVFVSMDDGKLQTRLGRFEKRRTHKHTHTRRAHNMPWHSMQCTDVVYMFVCPLVCTSRCCVLPVLIPMMMTMKLLFVVDVDGADDGDVAGHLILGT